MSLQERPRVVVSLLGAPPKPSKDLESRIWDSLRDAVQTIHSGFSTIHSAEELYRGVETLCLHGRAAQLCSELYRWCEAHISSEIGRLIQECNIPETPQTHPMPKRPRLSSPDSHQDAVDTLRRVDKIWSSHCQQMALLISIFLYLERTYIRPTAPGFTSLWSMGIKLFAQNFNRHPIATHRIIEALLGLVKDERDGGKIDRPLAKRVLLMLWELNRYTSHWESEFLQATEAYYSEESQREMQRSHLANYLDYVQRTLQKETERVESIMDQTTMFPLMELLESKLLSEHVPQLLEVDSAATPTLTSPQAAKSSDPGVNLCTLFAFGQIPHLRILYSFIKRVGELDLLQKQFSAWIKATGSGIVRLSDHNPQAQRVIIPQLLQFKAQVDRIHHEAFDADINFDWVVRGAFEHFLNIKPNEPAELVARFMDKHFTTGRKEGPEHLMAVLDQVMYLFRFIHSKDVFQEFYMQYLANRLLLKKSPSIEAEMRVIEGIKRECGPSYTSKLEGMLKDIRLSKKINQDFQKEIASWPAPDRPAFDFNVEILTTGNWPDVQSTGLRLPLQVDRVLEKFKTSYLARHERRRLLWNHPKSTCKLKARFIESQSIDLLCTAEQAVVLMLFNESKELTFDEIHKLSGIEDKEDLRSVLYSLCCIPSIRPLSKKPLNKKVLESDLFSVNRKFHSPLAVVQLTPVQVRQVAAVQDQTMEKLLRNRAHAIDANLVRVMKAHQKLPHHELVKRLQSTVPFDVTAATVKSRIESLIEREFIERDKQSPEIYRYVA